ncbi:MAG: hypothetical protein B7Z45_05550 [Azorhizobium sp. 12-66-6]|nr:MAG: hypothetical protein B7Z45_05550 [Azorhizobium sp. 12-66-6]
MMASLPKARSSAVTAGLAVVLGVLATHASGASLMPHRASYLLTLDPSRPSQKLDAADGRIDYEIRGDACIGYTVNLHQANSLDTGEGSPVTSDMLSTSWEDGKGDAYRFKTMNRLDGDGIVSRTSEGLNVQITKPRSETLELKGDILMPTEHVTKVLERAKAGDSVFEARVFDGSENGEKLYNTLAVIGRPGTTGPEMPDAARAALAGQTVYPITVSYFDTGSASQTPDYVMSFSLYESGVIGDMKIDYNDFVLKGSLQTFEALKVGAACEK